MGDGGKEGATGTLHVPGTELGNIVCTQKRKSRGKQEEGDKSQ